MLLTSGETVADRGHKIEYWWSTLSEEDRSHAREQVADGPADAWLIESLRRADIWLVSSFWSSVPDSWATFVPDDIAEFVRAN